MLRFGLEVGNVDRLPFSARATQAILSSTDRIAAEDGRLGSTP